MINLKINDKDYSVKTLWSEFTYTDYCNVIRSQDKPLAERISNFTGIPIQLVNQLKFQQLAFVSDALEFLDEPDNIFLFAVPFVDDLNIGRVEYGDLELVLQAIRKEPNYILSYAKIIKILYKENIDDKKALEVLGKGLFITTCISKFLEEFKRLGEYEPTIEEIEAGVDDLNKFGFFTTLDAVAEKYKKDPDEIMKWNARKVYNILLKDFHKSEVEKRLMQIRSRKK